MTENELLRASARAAPRDAGNKAPTGYGGSVPLISLPKGGGAVRGIGEKFAANLVTGTGSMTVPLATSPGRAGFGPELSLSYDSGAGNGPFGFGWTLSLPRITRKTDKGLPRYDDAGESDVFILSGAEDLVPLLEGDGSRHEDASSVAGYSIHRYRPRIEGLFARIERWTRQADGDVHWRSISKDNVLTLYGKDGSSRIADPADRQRVFSWLICETRDDKGNAVVYEYTAEDGAGVDLTQAHQLNRGDRTDAGRTANRYPKRIRYGNRIPLLAADGRRPRMLAAADIDHAGWMFEVVFDYGEHDEDAPTPDEAGEWDYRDDAFSSYRPGFEVRTARLCRRVLMFHHFRSVPEIGLNCPVHSTDLAYSHNQDPDARNPVYTFLLAVTQVGYRRRGNGYLRRSLPPVEFAYSQPTVQETVQDVSDESLENLPVGLDGTAYQWTDLHGEGVPGILTEQAGAWFYKRNLSPMNVESGDGTAHTEARFAPVELAASKPNLVLGEGRAEFMDLAGDGQPDLVMLDGPTPGLYEHDTVEGWQPFRPFPSPLNRDMRDPNLRLVDLDGDGHADVLITEDDAFVWHASLAEDGFGPARRVAQALDEEKGPRLVFADGTESVYLADLSGDGLTDLVRICNGEVCYWPNLGYARFGAKVTMDHPPQFDHPDQFDHRRIRLADIDGTGTTDIIYLHGDGVRLYFNQSGNSWSQPQTLRALPSLDDLASVVLTDLLGNGTACLVWSSLLSGDASRPMRYVDLMGGHKPHLLVKTANNLGAETGIRYAPSTRFYLEDKYAGKPWVTRLPFPVHVVERVETYDHVSRNRFVTRYRYHHGYFNGEEREFRGFGMVEQLDTEEFAALSATDDRPAADNIDAASHVPPVLTKTWFHTGAFIRRGHISDFFAGLLDGDDLGDYYREPRLTDAQFRQQLLPDTNLPPGLSAEEEREACRALKGSMLRQELYALDGTPREPHPYNVSERDYTLRVVQPRGPNRHAVFFAHPRESIDYHYERNPADPRIAHRLVLEVDDFGNLLKEAAAVYGRRQLDPNLPEAERDKQAQTLITYTEHRVTNSVEAPDDYRAPLSCETRTYELTGYTPSGPAGRLQFTDLVQPDPGAPGGLAHVLDSEIRYEDEPTSGRQRRLIEHVRTLYRPDDLGAAHNDALALLPLGTLEPLALPGETYQLASTTGLLTQVYRRPLDLLQPPTAPPPENLLPNPAAVLGVQGGGGGGYVADPDDPGHWWVPSGRVFFSPGSGDTPAEELASARHHFFLPHRYRDPFHTEEFNTETLLTYDEHALLLHETRDAMGNRVTVGERRPAGDVDPTRPGNDYRVLQPRLVTDANGNRTEVAFDALGMVVGTAVMGKPPPAPSAGDSLDGFNADLSEAQILDHLDHPLTDPHAILGRATTRVVYDLFAYQRTKDESHPKPAVICTLARETHDAELQPGQATGVQHGFSYSDGFGREIQQKIQAEVGPVPKRDAAEKVTVGADGQPELTDHDVSPRWVGSGWTVFNNKAQPVRQFEPFFTDTHRFEFDVRIGVSPVLFYDPVGRVVATLHPDHTWGKVVLDAWRQETWDASDTVLVADPKDDPNVRDFFRRLPDSVYLPSWHAQRQAGALGPQEQAAADKAAVHAETPAVAHADPLGRTCLTVAHNRFKYSNTPPPEPPTEEFYETRVTHDIEGNERAVVDAKQRLVIRYQYDMLGNRIHQASMEAGERWMLNDAAGNPLRAWDSRDHEFRSAYDPLRRPADAFLREGGGAELLVGHTVYGDALPNAEASNLRQQVVKVLDQAGVVTSDAYDFKGNLLETRRELAREYKTSPDWSTDVPLEAEIYTTRTAYDALNRPTELTTPDGSAIRPTYNKASLLERIDANLRGAPAATEFVADIDYNAKGQRKLCRLSNGVTTMYEYDPLTFRVAHLHTVRGVERLQDLRYTYGPTGNITDIQDHAQQTIFFNNTVVTPHADYTYDALYRLIEATGREHLGLVEGGFASLPTGPTDAPRVGLPHPGDGKTMGGYVQRYTYDRVGNLLQMAHLGTSPAHSGWTRDYTNDEPSLLEPGTTSNRLTRTQVGQTIEPYAHDVHGNISAMPHLPLMRWDHVDQLQATAQQVVTSGGVPETTFYVYDAGGERVRQVTERQGHAGQTPTRMKERVYLGGFEIHRKYEADGVTMKLERETLHVMDDRQRLALVETRTHGSGPAPEQLTRYQLSNHLGSASLELDADARIISYEEYYPYGSTSYQAVRSQTETSKRYRYTGKERDEENGLNYHGARYSALWLGRWSSCDPQGLVDGINLYTYSKNNPVIFADPNGTQGVKVEASDPKTIERMEDMGTLARVAYLQRLKRARPTEYTRLVKSVRGGEIDAFYVVEPLAMQMLADTRWGRREGKRAVALLMRRYRYSEVGLFGEVKSDASAKTKWEGGKATVTVSKALISSPEAAASALAHEATHLEQHEAGSIEQNYQNILEIETAARLAGARVWKEFGAEKFATIAGPDVIAEEEGDVRYVGDEAGMRRRTALIVAKNAYKKAQTVQGPGSREERKTQTEKAGYTIRQLFEQDPDFYRHIAADSLSTFVMIYSDVMKDLGWNGPLAKEYLGTLLLEQYRRALEEPLQHTWEQLRRLMTLGTY